MGNGEWKQKIDFKHLFEMLTHYSDCDREKQSLIHHQLE